MIESKVLSQDVVEIMEKQNRIYRAALRELAKIATVVSPDGKRFPIGKYAQDAIQRADELTYSQTIMEMD